MDHTRKQQDRLKRVARTHAEFERAHVQGTAALGRKDYRSLSDAIEAEGKAIKKLGRLVKEFRRRA